MSSASAVEAPRWVTESPVAAGEGHALLSWEAIEGVAEYELSQGERVRYEGPDLAFFASGLKEGVHSFRVRAAGGEWSEPLEVEVAYPSAGKVWTLLVVGMVVFVLTVVAVVGGYRRQRVREALAS